MKKLPALALVLAMIGCSSSRRITQRSEDFFRPLSAAEIRKLHRKGKIETPFKKEQPTLAAQPERARLKMDTDQSRLKAEADSLRQALSQLEKSLLMAHNEALELRLKIATATTDAASRTKRDVAVQPTTTPDKAGRSGQALSLNETAAKPKQDESLSGAEQRPSISLASVEKRIITPADQYTRALSLFHQRQYGRSIELLERIRSVTTDRNLSVRSKYWMGESYFGLGQYAKAFRQFEMVETSGHRGKQPDAYWMLGRCHEKMREFALARRCFERLIKEFPSNRLAPLARRRLGSSLYRPSTMHRENDQITV